MFCEDLNVKHLLQIFLVALNQLVHSNLLRLRRLDLQHRESFRKSLKLLFQKHRESTDK